MFKDRDKRKKVGDKAKKYGKLGALAFLAAILTEALKELGGGDGKSK